MPLINKLLIETLFLLLLLESNQYIVLPIYTDHPIDNITLQITNTSEFLSKVFYNNLFTYIKIGTPESKIYTYIDNQHPEFYLSNSESLFPSHYLNYSSSSFKLSSDCPCYYKTDTYMCVSNESFYFFTNFDLNKNIEMQNISFLYEINTKTNNNYPIMSLGLQLARSESMTYMEGIIEQMKKYDYIESTYWTIKYNEEKIYGENNKTIDAFLIIGLAPHLYNSNKYKVNNFRSAIADVKTYGEEETINYWGITFDAIFFYSNENNNNYKISISSKQFVFDNSINVIKATVDYLKNLEIFFLLIYMIKAFALKNSFD